MIDGVKGFGAEIEDDLREENKFVNYKNMLFHISSNNKRVVIIPSRLHIWVRYLRPRLT